MKTNRYLSLLTLLVILLVASLILTSFHQPAVLAQQTTAGLIRPQAATPTPVGQAASEIGSTDGILLMGVVIVLIVTLPLVFRKKGK
jgi:hypothetical protein